MVDGRTCTWHAGAHVGGMPEILSGFIERLSFYVTDRIQCVLVLCCVVFVLTFYRAALTHSPLPSFLSPLRVSALTQCVASLQSSRFVHTVAHSALRVCLIHGSRPSRVAFSALSTHTSRTSLSRACFEASSWSPQCENSRISLDCLR